MRDATNSGELVISCAYDGFVPEDVLSQLPRNTGRQYVAQVENGRVTRISSGAAEEVIGDFITGAHTTVASPPECETCETNTPSATATNPAEP